LQPETNPSNTKIVKYNGRFRGDFETGIRASWRGNPKQPALSADRGLFEACQ